MPNYGELSEPGSHVFPGWPSKVQGASSRGGRYNAPAGGMPFGASPPDAFRSMVGVPSSNFDAAGNRIVPDGVITVDGSKYVRAMYYQCAGNRSFECHSLEVQCLDDEHREYLNGNMCFELIFQVVTAANPGEAYDWRIHTNPEFLFTTSYVVRDWFRPKQYFRPSGGSCLAKT